MEKVAKRCELRSQGEPSIDMIWPIFILIYSPLNVECIVKLVCYWIIGELKNKIPIMISGNRTKEALHNKGWMFFTQGKE